MDCGSSRVAPSAVPGKKEADQGCSNCGFLICGCNTDIQPEYIIKLKQEMKKIKCEEAEIGWYRSRDAIIDQTGIVITMNGKNNEMKRMAIDFALRSTDDMTMPSEVFVNNSVTLQTYDNSKSLFQSGFAKLSKKHLFKFVEVCMTYENKQTEPEKNCWTFVNDVTVHLPGECVFQDRMTGFRKDLERIVRINKEKHTKCIKKELQNERCETVEIGFYQRKNYEVGIVMFLTPKRKLMINYDLPDDLQKSSKILSKSSNSSITIGVFNNSSGSNKCTLAKLNIKELVEFVDSCMMRFDASDWEILDPWKFLRKGIQYLHRKKIITSGDMDMLIDKLNNVKEKMPQYVKTVKEEMHKASRETADIGWYQSRNFPSHTGLVVLIDGQKKLTIDFKTPNSLYIVARSSKGLVTISDYRNSNSLYQRNLAQLKKHELIDFVEFCMEKYEVERSYYLDTENCGNFLRRTVATLREKGKISDTKIEIFAKDLDHIFASVSKESNKDLGIVDGVIRTGKAVAKDLPSKGIIGTAVGVAMGEFSAGVQWLFGERSFKIDDRESRKEPITPNQPPSNHEVFYSEAAVARK